MTEDQNITPEHHRRVKRAKEFETKKRKSKSKDTWQEVKGNKIIQKTRTATGVYSKYIGTVKNKNKAV